MGPSEHRDPSERERQDKAVHSNADDNTLKAVVFIKLKSQIVELRQQNGALAAERDDLQQQVTSLQQSCNEGMNQLSKTRLAARQQMAALQDEAQQLKMQLAEAHSSADDLKQQVDAARAEVHALLGAREASSQQLRGKLSQLQASFASKASECSSLTRKLAAADSLADALESELQALQQVLGKITSRMSDQEAGLKRHERRLVEVTQVGEQLAEQLESKAAALQAGQHQLQLAERTNQDLKDQHGSAIESLQQKLQDMIQQLKQTQDEGASMRKQLQQQSDEQQAKAKELVDKLKVQEEASKVAKAHASKLQSQLIEQELKNAAAAAELAAQRNAAVLAAGVLQQACSSLYFKARAFMRKAIAATARVNAAEAAAAEVVAAAASMATAGAAGGATAAALCATAEAAKSEAVGQNVTHVNEDNCKGIAAVASAPAEPIIAVQQKASDITIAVATAAAAITPQDQHNSMGDTLLPRKVSPAAVLLEQPRQQQPGQTHSHIPAALHSGAPAMSSTAVHGSGNSGSSNDTLAAIPTVARSPPGLNSDTRSNAVRCTSGNKRTAQQVLGEVPNNSAARRQRTDQAQPAINAAVAAPQGATNMLASWQQHQQQHQGLQLHPPDQPDSAAMAGHRQQSTPQPVRPVQKADCNEAASASLSAQRPGSGGTVSPAHVQQIGQQQQQNRVQIQHRAPSQQLPGVAVSAVTALSAGPTTSTSAVHHSSSIQYDIAASAAQQQSGCGSRGGQRHAKPALMVRHGHYAVAHFAQASQTPGFMPARQAMQQQQQSSHQYQQQQGQHAHHHQQNQPWPPTGPAITPAAATASTHRPNAYPTHARPCNALPAPATVAAFLPPAGAAVSIGAHIASVPSAGAGLFKAHSTPSMDGQGAGAAKEQAAKMQGTNGGAAVAARNNAVVTAAEQACVCAEGHAMEAANLSAALTSTRAMDGISKAQPLHTLNAAAAAASMGSFEAQKINSASSVAQPANHQAAAAGNRQCDSANAVAVVTPAVVAAISQPGIQPGTDSRGKALTATNAAQARARQWQHASCKSTDADGSKKPGSCNSSNSTTAVAAPATAAKVGQRKPATAMGMLFAAIAEGSDDEDTD